VEVRRNMSSVRHTPGSGIRRPATIDISSTARLYGPVWQGTRIICFFTFSVFASLYFFSFFPEDYKLAWNNFLVQPILFIGFVVSWMAIGDIRRSIGTGYCLIYVVFALYWTFVFLSAVSNPAVLDVTSREFPDIRWDTSLRTILGPQGPVLALSGLLGLVALWSVVMAIAALQLRYQRLPGLGLTIPEIDKEVQWEIVKSGDAPNMLRLLNWSRWQGILLGVLAGAVFLFPLFLLERGAGFWSMGQSLYVLPIVILVEMFLWRRARSLLAPDAKFVLKNDTRPPVLLLRSFKDDRAAVMPNALWRRIVLLFSLGQFESVKKRLEEVAAVVLHSLGPFIAVANLRSKVSQLGAFRAKLEDDEWQHFVLQQIQTSRLIVKIASKSLSGTWELQQACKKNALRKMLLLFPPKTDEELLVLWDHCSNALQDTPWHAAMVATDIKGALAVQFVDGGSIRIIRSNKQRERDYSLAILIGLYAILREDVTELPVGQHRCWGFTAALNRCKRIREWGLFCPDHSRQPFAWALIVFVILTSLALLSSAYLAGPQTGHLEADTAALRTLAKLLTSPNSDEPSRLLQSYKRDTFATVVQLRGTVTYPEGNLVFTLGCGFKPNAAGEGFIPNPDFNYPYFAFRSKEGGIAQLWLEKVKDGQAYRQIALLGTANNDIGVKIVSSDGKGGTLFLECPDTTLAQTTEYKLGERGCVRSYNSPSEVATFTLPTIELLQRVYGDDLCNKQIDYEGIRGVSPNTSEVKMQEQNGKSSAFWLRASESVNK